MKENRQISPARIVLFALIAGVGGLVISYYLGNSAGAAISLMLAAVFAISFCFRKARA